MFFRRQVFYYDEEVFEWVPLPSTIYNVTILSANTTHFSLV